MAKIVSERERLGAKGVDQQALLENLAQREQALQTAITALEELAVGDLGAAGLDDLERESKRQASAKIEAEARKIELAELRRRIGQQQAAIAQTAADVLACDRADTAAAGAALLAELRTDIAGLAAKLAELKTLSDRHASLDARIHHIPGFSGGRIPNSDNFEQLIGALTAFAERERFRQKHAAAAAGR